LLHPPVTSPLLQSNIPFSTLFSNTLSMNYKFSYKYKTSKTIPFHILTFTFLGRRSRNKRF
jgi:hypothetical protein